MLNPFFSNMSRDAKLSVATTADDSIAPSRIPYCRVFAIRVVAIFFRLYAGLTLMPSSQIRLVPGQMVPWEMATGNLLLLLLTT